MGKYHQPPFYGSLWLYKAGNELLDIHLVRLTLRPL